MDVHPALPSLQFLCRRAIEAAVEKEQEMEHLPLPAQEVQCLKLLKEPMVSVSKLCRKIDSTLLYVCYMYILV